MGLSDAQEGRLADRLISASQSNPELVAEALVTTEMLSSVVSLAVRQAETEEERAEVVDGVLYGLTEADFQAKYVRFPRIHRALGRVVFDENRILKPVKKS